MNQIIKNLFIFILTIGSLPTAYSQPVCLPSVMFNDFAKASTNANGDLIKDYLLNAPSPAIKKSRIEAFRDFAEAGKDFARLDPSAIKVYLKFDDNLKPFVLKFNDLPNGSTLHDFLTTKMNDNIIEALNSRPELMKSMVGHKQGAELPLEVFEKRGDEWYEASLPNMNNADRLAIKAEIDRSYQIQHSNKALQDGRDFGISTVGKVVDDPILRNQLDDALDINIDEWQINSEVQIWTNTDKTEYMIADIVLSKKNDQDVTELIIIEVKISENTAFTRRQREGWKKIYNTGNIDLKTTGNLKFNPNTEVLLMANNAYGVGADNVRKLHNGGDPNGNVIVENAPVDLSKHATYEYTPNEQ